LYKSKRVKPTKPSVLVTVMLIGLPLFELKSKVGSLALITIGLPASALPEADQLKVAPVFVTNCGDQALAEEVVVNVMVFPAGVFKVVACTVLLFELSFPAPSNAVK